jgi:hypothetical protein
VSAGNGTGSKIHSKPGLLWWLRQMVCTGMAIFFTGFGTCLLIGAYRLGNPFSFIMTFFGASLMIMISAVMVLGFIIRMRQAVSGGRGVDSPETENADRP